MSDTPRTDEQIAFVKEQLAGDTFGPECPDRPYYVLGVMGSFARLQELEEAKLNKRIAELEMLLNEYKDSEHAAVKREGEALIRAEAAEATLRAVGELPGKWRKEAHQYSHESEAKSAVMVRADELEALLKGAE